MWGVVQALVWLVGLTMLLLLAFAPRIGLHAVWDVLIPVAPALLAIAPGLWRNICPLGTTAQLPRRMRISFELRPSARLQTGFMVGGIAALLLIVPLRHVSFNNDAQTTLTALIVLGALAFVAGIVTLGKSGWCTGLCPVHPVEKLYGQEPALSITNAHCSQCLGCVARCPDSSAANDLLAPHASPLRRAAGWLLVGGFPGYIWGWFHVQDAQPGDGWASIAAACAAPFGAMAVSVAIHALLAKLIPQQRHALLHRSFAALSISMYYWYRLPALVGFGLFSGDGMLVDLRGSLSPAALLPVQLAVALFWGWWFVLRAKNRSAITR